MIDYEIIAHNKVNSNPKISILISVYNKAGYIGTTLESLLKQTYLNNDFQLVIVDDCSTDNSVEQIIKVINEFSNYLLVKLKENSGSPASPRNLSIELAQGEYVMYIDGDDILPNNSLELLLESVRNNNADYVIGQSVYKFDKKETFPGKSITYKKRLGIDKSSIKNAYSYCAPHGRIIKKSVIINNNLKFLDMKFGEDVAFFAEVLLHSEKINTITDNVYFVNRFGINDSLVKKTTLLQKGQCKLDILNYLLKKYHDSSQAIDLFYRLIDLDLIGSLSFSQSYIKNTSEHRRILEEMLEAMVKYEIDERKVVREPKSKVFYQLIKNKEWEKSKEFVDWVLNDKSKVLQKSGKIAFYQNNKLGLSFNVSHQIELLNLNISKDDVIVSVKVYDKISKVSNIILVNDKDSKDFHSIKFNKSILKNELVFKLGKDLLSQLELNKHHIFVVFDEYIQVRIPVHTLGLYVTANGFLAYSNTMNK